MEAARNDIQFMLNDRLIVIDFQEHPGLKPTTTVLNYLRTLPGFKGVKEGCAEGDCGACTVVVAEPDHGKLVYRTLDSCLVFLPQIHGKQLITVEHLSQGNQLHPVQQAMVDHNGSQCGYCTPGVVMSLFGLFKNTVNPDRDTIHDALTGNLCRCTGYRPIAGAAVSSCHGDTADKFSEREAETLRTLGEINRDKHMIELRGSSQLYLKPLTLADALECRKSFPEAVLVSGSTDVALRQTKKHEHLPEIIDLGGIEELTSLAESESEFYIGSGVTLEKLRLFSEKRLPPFYKMLSVFGSLQIRNLATLGGNAASASPIGDTLPLLFAYRASVELISVSGTRRIGIGEFITGYRSTALSTHELIAGFILPKPSAGTLISCYKVSKRKNLDISTVSACFRLERKDGIIDDVILAYGGMAASTARAFKTESFLKGKPWSQPRVEEAMQVLAGEFTPLSDARANAAYRKAVACNLLLKFFTETENSEL